MNNIKTRFILLGVILTLISEFIGVTALSPLLKLANMSFLQIFIFSRVYYWLCLLLVFIYAIKIEKQPFLLWEEKKYSLRFSILSILKLFLMCFLGMLVVGIIIKLASLGANKSDKFSYLISLVKKDKLLLVFTCITAGVTEELIFRGYLMSRLQLFFRNKYVPIVLSSILFSMLHYSWGTVANVIGPFFIGMIFAIHYQKYQNIKILIACHFLWDLMALTLNSMK